MRELSFDQVSFQAGGERLYLNSGEIHYFRVPRAAWRDRLERLKAAGGNCVATYVPWLLHEPAEGHFCFDDPQFDVDTFLDLCAEVGLWALVRPGPYQYSELAYDGLPGWLFAAYPDIRARHLDGTPFSRSSVSYLHPLFLEKARRWYHEVTPRLARHQVRQGGAVAAVQVDNELMGIHLWFGGCDYHPAAMGVGRDTGRWPDFLRARYGELDAVNAAYGITATRWAEVAPLPGVTTGSAEERRRVRDYRACYFASIADYAETLAGWLRDDGITVPVVHNAACPEMNGYFHETVERLGGDFLLGSDHYYNLDMDWAQNNPTPQYAARVFTSLEMLRLLGKPPTVLELPGGSAADFPPITANDALCCYLTNLALGMKGHNYYIFAGGYNPPGAGTTGDVYDYGAAISPSGENRELYAAQQQFARLLAGYPWLTEAKRVADCRIGMIWEYSRADAYGSGEFAGRFFHQQAWEFMRKGMLMTACCASLSPELVDLASDAWVTDTARPVMVASSIAMPRAAQERLVAFLDGGGKVLLAPVVPMYDEHLTPCTLLADFLGGVSQAPFTTDRPRVHAFDVPNVLVNAPLYATERRNPLAVTTAGEESTGREIGWQLALPSGGVISVLGYAWRQARREQEEMLRRALTPLGVSRCVVCDNPSIWTSLRSDGIHTMLFLLNLFTAPLRARVRFRDPVDGQWVDTGQLRLPGMSVQCWSEGRMV